LPGPKRSARSSATPTPPPHQGDPFLSELLVCADVLGGITCAGSKALNISVLVCTMATGANDSRV
jgi:hypothetical protein